MIRTPFLDGWTVGPKLGAFESRSAADEPRARSRSRTTRSATCRARPTATRACTPATTRAASSSTSKTIDVPAEWRDKSVIVEFEGVYRDAAVFLNGDFVVHEPNGYNAFTAVLDPYPALRRAEPHHRRGQGAQGQPVVFRSGHLSSRAPARGRSGALRARRTARHDPRHRRRARDRRGVGDRRERHPAHPHDAGHLVDHRPGRRRARDGSAPVTVLPGTSATARARLAVPSPAALAARHPALHVVEAALDDERGERIDTDAATFGIRRLQLDPQHGLRINGEVVKLRGACVHHDNGPLGAATIAAAEDRRVRLLKEAGFNALRSAHNPMSRAMLDACDRHGVLVMDELTDVWTRSKTAFDGVRDRSPSDGSDDVAALVAKDFNHPSVVLYSIGNEILELAHPGRLGVEPAARRGHPRARRHPVVTNGINGIIANLDRMRDGDGRGRKHPIRTR